MLLTFAVAMWMAQDPASGWRAEMERGKQAWSRQDYTAAAAALNSAAEAAREAGGTAVLECLRALAGVHRSQGDHARAESVLARALESAEESLEVAAALGELSAAQRAQGRIEPALASIERAIRLREARPDSRREDLARDLTTAAVLRLQAGATEAGTETLQRAVKEWDTAAPGDARSLPALEALAAAHRDAARYAEAEPLLWRALRLRESSGSPDSAEVISVVDSLAYVEFGLKKMDEAETLYKRLLALWERNAGPEHPMVALTLDKMAEFYAFQQRYADAETCARQAAALRSKTHVASLNQTGRILLMQAKLSEAEEWYGRTIKIGDLAQAEDETLDPPLRIYAKVLRALNRDEEANALERRVKDALMRKADREGRRPSPVKLPAAGPRQ
ncbi:MAG: tetratricopeptide repeat protein [Bryobacteraceae bacterium]